LVSQIKSNKLADRQSAWEAVVAETGPACGLQCAVFDGGVDIFVVGKLPLPRSEEDGKPGMVVHTR
jgi:hypothetical protein